MRSLSSVLALVLIVYSLVPSLAHGHKNQDGWIDGHQSLNRPLMHGDTEPTALGENPHRGLETLENAAHISKKPTGDSSCPCLSADAVKATLDSSPTATVNSGLNFNVSSYGVGCAPHDIDRQLCGDTPDCVSVVPLPPDCDRSWCLRSWCYVDPDHCEVKNTPSVYFRGWYFSYSTCGFLDSFTYTERLNSLRGKTLQVGFNSNSGGWRGAYNPDGNFAVNRKWDGPVVKFIRNAALEGGFSINVTQPPAWLKDESQKFFGSSSFDYCIYATALGYLDLCVAAYTMSDKRTSVTTFFETVDDPIYLITYADTGGVTWNSFMTALLTIFQPFTLGAWLMIIVFCLPVLGLLMLWHEHGSPGSAYPRTVPVMIIDKKTGTQRFATQQVGIVKHIAVSLYMAFLSFFQESYNQSVVTVGGKINLLAISSFVLLVLAVYTANLAAILTSDVAKTSVSNIDEAIQAGYNFCASRKVAGIVMDLHKVPTDKVVPDPIELGGDGAPGFNCPDCQVRQRVFDFMRLVHEDPSLYCNAAFASLEDLEVLHSTGQHCEKTRVGDAIAQRNIGVPLSGSVSDGLVSLFHQMKNNGIIDKEMAAAKPASQCPVMEGEGSALSVEQLTGIWIITFSFAVAGIIAKLIHFWVIKRRTKAENNGLRARSMQRYDQWGNPTDHEIVIDGHTYDLDAVRKALRSVSTRKIMHETMKCHPIKEADSFLSEEEVSEQSFEDELALGRTYDLDAVRKSLRSMSTRKIMGETMKCHPVKEADSFLSEEEVSEQSLEDKLAFHSCRFSPAGGGQEVSISADSLRAGAVSTKTDETATKPQSLSCTEFCEAADLEEVT